ncbi:MAG: carboxypeptidase M32 [Halobacteria archaeon]
MPSYYEELLGKAGEIAILQSIISLLQWDLETHMPPSGIDLRKQQLAMLSKIAHERMSDPEIEMLLNKIDIQNLSEPQRRNVYLIRKNYEEQAKLPEKLIMEIARQRAATIDIWRKAKAASDFAMLKPELEKLFELKKQMAHILMEVKVTSNPYDALIDIYEPKLTADFLNKILKELKRKVLLLVEKYRATSDTAEAILKLRIPVDIQRHIVRELAKFLDYDIESNQAWGRIDESEHPFTAGYYQDIRITTRYREDSFTSSIFSILHEAGHALYEHSLNPEFMYQPIGTPCSYGFGESQARLLENIIGRSREFWGYFLPKLCKLTGGFLPSLDLNRFLIAINQIKPSRIRIEADEVTYNLHIIIRFEIELDLFTEKIEISELPQVWNEKYLDYLDLKIENDAEGVLQDIHWASGHFGYFPSYALGNLYSAQILSKLEKEVNWRGQIAMGSFLGVKKWLIENVYSYGNLYDPLDLIKKITGEELSIEYYLNYLKSKYIKLPEI